MSEKLATDIPKILITTRFSFFGKSGWKSDYSANPDELFDKNRLLKRFWLFENITLPCLKAQTDQDFHYYVLSSKLMPDWAKEKLVELCTKHLDESRFTIGFGPPAYARKYQAWAIKNVAGADHPVAQVVLDDDDALSTDYIANLKTHLTNLQSKGTLDVDKLPYFITFPRGYALSLREKELQLWAHKYPFINLGLTMIGTTSQKNILGISHKAAPKLFGYIRDDENLMYIRTLSDVNDSRVDQTVRWKEVADWTKNKDVCTRFPFLTSLKIKEYAALANIAPKAD